MDALRADTPTVSLLGLEDVRSSKSTGEYLTLFNAEAIKALYSVARSLCQQVAPDVIHISLNKKAACRSFSMAQKGPLTDLELHRPPCKKFHANQAFYACGQIAQILLRALQYKALPKTERKHGIRPLIRKIVRSVGRLTCSGRKWTLHFVKTTVALEWLWQASKRLDVKRAVVST